MRFNKDGLEIVREEKEKGFFDRAYRFKLKSHQ